MPRRPDLRKVLVIGSGPIVIGQAAEFDYAGAQACRALQEENLEVVLVNSNPATIMTDMHMAQRIYMEPLTPSFIEEIIARERPQGLLATLGGQVGLNLAVAMADGGVLSQYGVRLLGTPLSGIKKAEDRQLFKDTMAAIGEPVPASAIVCQEADALAFAAHVGYPVIVRPAYTLGGTGGGIASDRNELAEIVQRGLTYSPIGQVLIEQSVAGWKEVEYEVMRDGADNCITVCNMENIDPVGVHTGDSIVVAPSQTLSDRDYQMLRSASLRIIRALGIEGGCNVQYALDPRSARYYVIEVNPRVSRSSALASKATGYPIAKVATKIALGYHLDEIGNAVTGKTTACFEPTLDYVVVKMPRWPFDKFRDADRSLGTQMKATGEVMAIDRNLEGALMKALRSLEIDCQRLFLPAIEKLDDTSLRQILIQPSDRRLFAIAAAFRRGWRPERVAELTGIDAFFVDKVRNLVEMERRLTQVPLTAEVLRAAKKLEFTDQAIAALAGLTSAEVASKRRMWNIVPGYKMVDTCAAEFAAATPYYYATYNGRNEVSPTAGRKIVVLGAGPIRIGQGIEFDYCSVHAAWTLRELGITSIIINNNPETVSTDFDTSDRLYFEPLTAEDVRQVVEREQAAGVIAQFGGQTAINLATKLAASGITVLGTSVASIDQAEDRYKFDAMLARLGIPRPPGAAVLRASEAIAAAETVGYPVLVRPSYVLGGRAMAIVDSQEELITYLEQAVQVAAGHPILIDKYLLGMEVEVDAVADGKDVLIPGIMEHVERAGVHSGDSIAVYPAQHLRQRHIDTILDYTTRIARELAVQGLVNIQFVIAHEVVYVIEVNPRSSRTVPFLSKVTGVPMVDLATRVAMGETLAENGWPSGLLPAKPFVAVKAPVFSFAKLSQVDISLGPEMKSTGEVIGVDMNYPAALYKAITAAGIRVPAQGTILATVADKDKEEAAEIIAGYAALGFKIIATAGTARYLAVRGLTVRKVNKLAEGEPHLVDMIKNGSVDLVINTTTRGRQPARDGYQIRRAAVEHAVPCLTSLDTAREILRAITALRRDRRFTLQTIQEYCSREG